jgi:hypothetical protein
MAALGRSIEASYLTASFFEGFDEHGGHAWAELYCNSCHGHIGRLAYGGVELIYSRAEDYRHGKFIVRHAHVACVGMAARLIKMVCVYS